MPTPGTSGNIPEIRKTVTGAFRMTAKLLDSNVITSTATKVAITVPRRCRKIW